MGPILAMDGQTRLLQRPKGEMTTSLEKFCVTFTATMLSGFLVIGLFSLREPRKHAYREVFFFARKDGSTGYSDCLATVSKMTEEQIAADEAFEKTNLNVSQIMLVNLMREDDK